MNNFDNIELIIYNKEDNFFKDLMKTAIEISLDDFTYGIKYWKMKYQIFIKKDISHKNIFSFTLTPEKKILQNIFFNIPLNQNTYKKSFGKTLIIGGASGYLGAALISGKSALSSGSRYVEIMTTKSHSEVLPIYQP